MIIIIAMIIATVVVNVVTLVITTVNPKPYYYCRSIFLEPSGLEPRFSISRTTSIPELNVCP